MTTTEKGLYASLDRLEIPQQDFKECEDNESEYLNRLTVYIERITEWIEVGHLTAFEIEQRIKQDEMDIQTIENLEHKLREMQKTIDYCNEIKEDITMGYKLKLTKVQSEWSGLQQFIQSLKLLVSQENQKKQVKGLMETILIDIDMLSYMIFEFHERRQQHVGYEELLVEIDNQVGPLFNDVERVYQRMISEQDKDLVRIHQHVQEKWEWLRVEIDQLKVELKEDRWLAVFKQVADQVEGMMDGLDKTVSQYIHQMRRNTPQSTCSTSSTESISSGSNTSKSKSIEKNFDAKFKYYSPSIEKMLSMLGSGIASRISKDDITATRHQAMVHRWEKLRLTMDHVRKRDSLDRPMSPARSISRLSETGSFKSPEPEHFNMFESSRRRSSIDSETKRSKEEKKVTRQPRASPMMRRAVTPSLIPRPRTPSEIPRPQSTMARKITNKKEKNKKYYKADMKDELDIEIATMINSSPVTIHCQKAPQGQGKYYFGNELTSLGGGKKVYSCKLMNYRNQKNKVLIRVGGGWQDLEIFLLEHMNLVGN